MMGQQCGFQEKLFITRWGVDAFEKFFDNVKSEISVHSLNPEEH